MKERVFLFDRHPFSISLPCMKKALFIFFSFLISTLSLVGQRSLGDSGGFSHSSQGQSEQKDSVSIDSLLRRGKRLEVYQLTKKLGDVYEVERDSSLLNTAQKTFMEDLGISVAYLANVGAPAQSRIFSERPEARDFIFADAYHYNLLTPENAPFYRTRVPYTEMMYHKTFGTDMSEERLKGMMTFNFGKKLNVGAEFDYLYSRGHYNSNGSKLYNFRLFSSYQTDRYSMHAYFYNNNYVNFENGGLTNDRYVAYTEEFEGRQGLSTRDYPVKYSQGNVWNRVKGQQFFLSHRYNLGFTKEEEEETSTQTKADAPVGSGLGLETELEAAVGADLQAASAMQTKAPASAAVEVEDDEEFVPVASIIHTLHYSRNFRRFISNNAGSTNILDTIYTSPTGEYQHPLHKPHETALLNDVMRSTELKNTVALSLREGFQEWVKFGLSAFISFENRSFEYPSSVIKPDTTFAPYKKKEFSTFIGGELSSRSTDLLSYYAFGEFGLLGDDIGELRVNGHIETRFKLFGKEASVKALGRIENTTPAFFQRNYFSRYFSWNEDFSKVQRYYVGGEIKLASTNTLLAAGVENVTNYIYFGERGLPQQYSGSIQIMNFRVKQNFYYKALGWENEVVAQLGSKDDVLPLPKLSAYSNLYVHFKIAKVMTAQLGADIRYFTEYYAPYYEPANQQFRLQNSADRVKVGNYPLINAYANFHLKQAKFFVAAYNLGSQFIRTKHFSFAHYPLNPFTIKLGVLVYFNN